jgi:hypothetical protein
MEMWSLRKAGNPVIDTMRIKDIAPVRGHIKNISFVRNTDGLWEIHFVIGEATRAITKHYPTTARTWKSLDNAVEVAEETFDPKLMKFNIILKGKQ